MLIIYVDRKLQRDREHSPVFGNIGGGCTDNSSGNYGIGLCGYIDPFESGIQVKSCLTFFNKYSLRIFNTNFYTGYFYIVDRIDNDLRSYGTVKIGRIDVGHFWRLDKIPEGNIKSRAAAFR